MLCVVLLAACGKQAAEEPALTQPTTEATQPQGTPESNGEEGEIPEVTIPQQTQPVTDAAGVTEPTEGTTPTEPPKATEPTEVSEPSQPTETSKPSQPTTEAEPTEPTETTEPTQPPALDENELPLVPLF